MRWAIVIGTLSFVTLFLSLHCKPSWYRPFDLSPEDLPLVEASVANVIDAVSDSMVLGQSFEVVLTNHQVNQWLAGLPQLFPRWNREWPREIYAGAADFDEGTMRVGLHTNYGGWQSILGFSAKPSITSDHEHIAITLSDVRIGAIPCPAWLWRPLADPHLKRVAEKNRLENIEGANEISMNIDDTQSGSRTIIVPNEFLWPNGRRWFRVGSIKLERGGTMRIVIVPL